MHKLVIDRIEEEFAICQFDDKIEISIPLSRMPDDVGEGDEVFMLISKEEKIDENKKNNVEAKELLNELLQH